MSIMMVECVICKKEVSKRSTISLKKLGGGDGRACKTHESVEKLLEDHERKNRDERAIERTKRTIMITNGAAYVRTMCTFRGFSPGEIYVHFREKCYSADIINEIREEVARQGGSEMSPSEILETFLMAEVLLKKF